MKWIILTIVFVYSLKKVTGVETCPVGNDEWKLYNEHCYKFVSENNGEPQTWWSSNQLCLQEGAYLVSILNKEENDFLVEQMNQLSDRDLWTGGRSYEDTGFQWADTNPFDYANWAPGEPNSYLNQEDCIAVFTDNGLWNDLNCARTIGRICKKPNGVTHPPPIPTLPTPGFCPKDWVHVGVTGRCFRFFAEEKNFDAAHYACKEADPRASLVSIHNAKELAYITAGVGMLRKNSWIGLRMQSEFVWVDQSGMTFTSWAPGEPNGVDVGEHCVESLFPSGLWNDIYCDHSKSYICSMNQDSYLNEDAPLPTCSEPFQNYLNYRGNCYRSVNTTANWKNAEKMCSNEGGHLASAHDISEASYLWVLAQNEQVTDPWIGFNNIKDQKQFKWSDGWPAYYTNWGDNEPDVNMTDNNCVRINSEDGSWQSELCDELRPFLCKYTNLTVPTPDPPTNGHCPGEQWLDLNGGYCYLLETAGKNWNEAHTACLLLDSNFSSIHTQEEMNLLHYAIKDIHSPVWIGLIEKASGFGWSDNSAYDYNNWAEGEPNSGDEKCTEVYPHNGLWNDVSCERVQPYICKTPKIRDPGDPGKTGNNLSGGAIFGIVIAVLAAVALVGFVSYRVVTDKGTGGIFDGLNFRSNTV